MHRLGFDVLSAACWRVIGLALVAIVLGLACPEPAGAQSLRGGRRSLDNQVAQARVHDFTFMRLPSQVRKFVSLGLLVPLEPNRSFELKEVSYPYVRPEVRTFVLRLSSQYRRACGEKLVVTSATRPSSAQPINASSRSVHPTGMALDLRRSDVGACRTWIERVLLQLEKSGALEATHERHPPHYHVAVYPKPYAAYVAQVSGQASVGGTSAYRVRAHDTLWSISKRFGTTPERLRSMNGLRSNTIRVGETLEVPAKATSAAGER